MKTFFAFGALMLSFIFAINLPAQVNQYDSLGNKTGRWITHYNLTDSILDMRYSIPRQSIASDFSSSYRNLIIGSSNEDTLKNIVLEEYYFNNTKNGYFYFYFNDSILFIRGYYSNGKLSNERQYFEYDTNGVIRCDAILKQNKGKLNGPLILLGWKEVLINIYQNDKKHGKSITYDESGNVIYITNFKDGNLIDNVNFYIADSITFFTNRKKDEFTRVYENGYWVQKIYQDFHRTIKEPSQFERIFDINRFYIFFHRKKLRKEYSHDFRITPFRKEELIDSD